MARPGVMTLLPVHGGPFDGTMFPRRRSLGSFGWLGTEGRAHARPGAGRTLYRQAGGAWIYPGASARQCRCGAIVEQTATGDRARCLCGAT